MKKYLHLLILIFSLWNTTHLAAQDEMPIIAYIGIPDGATTEENFKVFSECGFTVSLYPYPSLNTLVKACRYADKYNVKILGSCPEMRTSPAQAAYTLKQEKGFFGYMIQDEPSVPEMLNCQKTIERLIQTDDQHIFYINLFPYYNQASVEASMKAESYPDYLNTASATSCQQLSFDYYPITTKGIRDTWYHNLEMVRQASIQTGKPFWGFALSVPHDVPYTPETYYPMPTRASLRLQVYSNLAYGAQAIQYFTYWYPGDGQGFHFHDAPISEKGQKTKTYTLVQQMNNELKAVSKLFYGAKVTSVHHLGAIPDGTTRQNDMPVNLRSLKVVGRQGAIISQLTKNGHQYLAIVNKSHEDQLTVRIRPRNGVPRHLTKTLEEETMRYSYTMEAGDMLLFKLK